MARCILQGLEAVPPRTTGKSREWARMGNEKQVNNRSSGLLLTCTREMVLAGHLHRPRWRRALLDDCTGASYAAVTRPLYQPRDGLQG